MLLHMTLQKLRKEKEAKLKEEQKQHVAESAVADEKPVEKKTPLKNSSRKSKA